MTTGEARRARLGLALLVLATSWTTPLEAEVRLKPEGNGVRVQCLPGPRGVWTPNGAWSRWHLNPLGDVLGDGFPGLRSGSGRAIAAWHRPSEDALLVSTGDDSGWSVPRSLSVGRVLGAPVPVEVAGSVVVAWQGEGADLQNPLVSLALLADDEEAVITTLGEGFLLAGVAVDGTPLLVTAERQAGELFELVVQAVITPIDRPIEILRLPLHEELDEQLLPRVRLDLVEPKADRSEPIALLTWWSGPHVLQYAILDADGDVLDRSELEATRGPGFSQASIQRVLKLVRQR